METQAGKQIITQCTEMGALREKKNVKHTSGIKTMFSEKAVQVWRKWAWEDIEVREFISARGNGGQNGKAKQSEQD